MLVELGHLHYETLQSKSIDANDYWVVGVAVVGGALLSAILVVLVVYKRKSTRAHRQFKRLQLQLDSLESNIRNECKQGESDVTQRDWRVVTSTASNSITNCVLATVIHNCTVRVSLLLSASLYFSKRGAY